MQSGGAPKSNLFKAGASVKKKTIIRVEKFEFLKYKLLTFFIVKLDEKMKIKEPLEI